MTGGRAAAMVAWFLAVIAGPTSGVFGQKAAKEVNASGGVLVPEQACYDVTHYDLAVTVDPKRKTIDGAVTMTARLVEESARIALDLDRRLRIRSVQLNGADARWRRSGGRILIELPSTIGPGETITVGIGYGGAPRVAPNPPWDGGFTWAKTKDGRPWIATSCQGEGADLWWPCKDHPSDEPDTMDIRVTLPKGLFCASNGVLVSDEEEKDGTHTEHWHVANPIANYCVALNIAPYVRLDATFDSIAGESVPVHFWVLPENEEKGRALLPEFLDHLRFFEELCGPYPFRNEKYGVVETPHLGMEHQTIIAYGYRFRRAPHDYDWLHHHELSHEWWGNLVTCRDWKDMWIHEGFGTYMQPLYLERRRGVDAYRHEMATYRRRIANRRAVAPLEVRNSKEIYFDRAGVSDSDIYFKGAWVLHSLRWLVGDAEFLRIIRRMAYPDPKTEAMVGGGQCRFTDTSEFQRIAEGIAGMDLAWFVSVYLRQPELPELAMRRRGERLELRWISPNDEPFPMPVEIVVDGEPRRVAMPGGKAVLTVPRKATVEIDPNDRVLRKADESRRGRMRRR